MDVYGFSLSNDQYTSASVQLYDMVDGAAPSLNVIQIGWEVAPMKYNDSHTHLAVVWTVGIPCSYHCFSHIHIYAFSSTKHVFLLFDLVC
jgi:hypothetical protein